MLVNNFVIVSARGEEEARLRMLVEAKNGRVISNTLDPLLRFLATNYVDDADLKDRLYRLFLVRAVLLPVCPQSFMLFFIAKDNISYPSHEGT